MAASQIPKQDSNRELDRLRSTGVEAFTPNIGDIPSIIAEAGARATKRFTTFFTDQIRNRNTREVYFRAAFQFLTWCEGHDFSLELIESYHVSTHVEQLLSSGKSKPTVKQHLSAIRKLCDWLVVGQIVPQNPTHACAVLSTSYAKA